MPEKTEYELDGECFSTLEEFAKHFSERVLSQRQWSGNLDAFNDILRGGFGTPEQGFKLVWRNANISKQRLGYSETVRQLEKRLAKCHPTNREAVAADLKLAQQARGPTVFDWVVEIISEHSAGGAQPDDGVELELR
jgi:RNAse (barnase) inhibitor barstar